MESLLSPHWYRVASMRPALRSHVTVHRQQLGQRVSYLLQDRVTGHHHRLGEEAHELVSRMDGHTPLEDIWRLASDRLGAALPSQGETMRLLTQLLQADLVHCDDKRLAEVLTQRRQKAQSRRRWSKLVSPLSIKLPLFDPDRFLTRTQAGVAPLLGRVGLVVWTLLVGSGLLLALMQLPALTANVSDRIFSLENAVLLWLLYPLIKVVHELGHAYMIKRWGGEVHELGVMLMVFFPVPYVDASASMAFPRRYQRMMVAAMGVMVELALASVAMWVWVWAEPGVLRSVAFGVVLIAGVSSLVFNGNPLMRYDAYYVLAEAVGQPALDRNGAKRWTEWLLGWLRGARRETAFADYTPGERAFMMGYAVVAFGYRTVVMLLIAVLMVKTLPVIGVVLAALVLFGTVLLPLYRLWGEWRRAGREAPQGGAGIPGRLATAVAVVLALLFVLPLPLTSTVQGVVMPEDESQVRAGADGDVVQEWVRAGDEVQLGQALLQLQDEPLQTAARLASARELEIVAQVTGSVHRPAQVDVLGQELAYARQQVQDTQQRLAALKVRAPLAGAWMPVQDGPLLGRHYQRGELLGYVVEPSRLKLVAVVNEDQVLPVRDHTERVSVRGATPDGQAHTTRVQRLWPSATHALPHPSLTLEGGGRIARNPEVTDRLEALRKFFWVELDVTDIAQLCVDCRVQVRFEHPPEPIAWRWGRWLRRQFLGLFND